MGEGKIRIYNCKKGHSIGHLYSRHFVLPHTNTIPLLIRDVPKKSTSPHALERCNVSLI